MIMNEEKRKLKEIIKSYFSLIIIGITFIFIISFLPFILIIRNRDR